MISLIIFLIFFKIFHFKNLLFPFKKLTIEYLNKTKSISDFVHYNIYTNIEMGTPKNQLHISLPEEMFYFIIIIYFSIHIPVKHMTKFNKRSKTQQIYIIYRTILLLLKRLIEIIKFIRIYIIYMI